jgi:hypothetical protein
MLAMAATANTGRPKRLEDAQPDGEMSGAEAKAILTSIARSEDPVLKIRAVEALGKIIDQESQRERDEYSMDEAVEASFKAAGVYGGQFLAESFFTRHRSLPWNSDAFTAIAPKLAAAFSDRWQHFRDLLPGHRLKFEEVGLA